MWFEKGSFPFSVPLSLLTAFMLLTSLTSCAVGPDFHRPQTPPGAGYTAQPLPATASARIRGGAEQSFVDGLDIPQQWWALFESPQLNALIERSIKANPTLDAANAALRQSRELVAAQKGFYYPTVQGSFSVTGTKDAVNTFGSQLNSGTQYYTLKTAQLTLNYPLDVFGLNRRQVESLKAQAEFQGFQLEAAYLTLTSNVVTTAVQEALIRAQIDATCKIIEIERKLLEMMCQHLALGYVSLLDVAAQESALAQVEATLPPLQKQLAQTRDMLSALAGRFPNEEMEEKFDLDDLHLPRELPVSLPSKLIEQRPDTRAAEAQWHTANALVGVAVANQLPQFSITGAYGGVSTQLPNLFPPGNIFYNLSANVTHTIFDGFTLLHQKRAAQAAAEQAAAQYRGTVLNAFQNVADTLHALQEDANALKAALAAERAAKKTLDLTTEHYKVGDVTYLDVLSAEQAWWQALTGLMQARADRYTDTAALFMALGGGWWNRSEKAKELEIRN